MNDGVNASTLVNCLETIADRVAQTFVKDSSIKALSQNLDINLRTQTAALLELCCHKRKKVHTMAIKTVEKIVASFAQVFADGNLVTLLLELVQLAWLSCEAEYRDEVNHEIQSDIISLFNLFFFYSILPFSISLQLV
jgi:phosphatidylinositol 4-kinase